MVAMGGGEGQRFAFYRDLCLISRTFKGGLLKVLDAFPGQRLKSLLPLKIENPDAGCIR